MPPAIVTLTPYTAVKMMHQEVTVHGMYLCGSLRQRAVIDSDVGRG